MVEIKKVNTNEKFWNHSKSKKIIRQRIKVNKNHRRSLEKTKNCNHAPIRKNKPNAYTAYAPQQFSLINNPHGTISYFNKIINIIRNEKNTKYREVYFDLNDVTYLSIDAIMYLLAVLKNTKSKFAYQYRFLGNVPRNEKARECLTESGFFKYANLQNPSILSPPNNSKITIKSGSDINLETIREVCDFVNAICGTNKLYTKHIYNIIAELMGNTKDHAYGDKTFMVPYWYIFVENEDDKIKFVFLDTGYGIPNTIHKKFFEKLNVLKEHSEYIFSAFRGDVFRTSTGETFRGKGLPRIYEHFISGRISDLRVISGNGYCSFKNNTYDKNNSIHKINIGTGMYGTLFYWEINKQGGSVVYA